MDELSTLQNLDLDFMYWVAGLFALLELGKWVYSFKDFIFEKIGIKTKGMIKREEFCNRLKNVEDSIVEIKNTSKHNVNMFLEHERQVIDEFGDIKTEIVTELNRLYDKLHEQQEEADRINEANRKTDCAMLRDRIASGMRYFSGDINPVDGKVHIKFSDYENMDALFQEYFAKDGNGPFKKMYEDEFKHFIIDR